MAYGGGPGGIIYVVRFNHPAVLITGAIVIAGALTAVGLLVRGPSTRAAALSIALALMAVPLSAVLATQDHGSAPVLTAAALAGFAIAIPVILRRTGGASLGR
jgi:hypothetical protein